ncbi:MAG TPA: hypothetical protein VEI57_09440 [Nitrospirota bacterium]|nr:hypothetical protein [Nitrospirota bacterium]
MTDIIKHLESINLGSGTNLLTVVLFVGFFVFIFFLMSIHPKLEESIKKDELEGKSNSFIRIIKLVIIGIIGIIITLFILNMAFNLSETQW